MQLSEEERKILSTISKIKYGKRGRPSNAKRSLLAALLAANELEQRKTKNKNKHE